MVYGQPPPNFLTYVTGTVWVKAVEQELLNWDQLLKTLKTSLKDSHIHMERVYIKHHQEKE